MLENTRFAQCLRGRRDELSAAAIGARAPTVLFVNPDSSAQAYAGPGRDLLAIEAANLGAAARPVVPRQGVSASRSRTATPSLARGAVRRVRALKPRLVVFVVYGQNPELGHDQHDRRDACSPSSSTPSCPSKTIAFQSARTPARCRARC